MMIGLPEKAIDPRSVQAMPMQALRRAGDFTCPMEAL